MSQPDYPLFSKRYQRPSGNQKYTREKRGAYNFEKTKEYSLAEKWFQERKETQRELIPVPVPPAKPTPASVKPVTKGPPPGLTQQRPRHDSCDLDLKIPSYDDFDYVDPDEVVISPPPQPVHINTNINLFEEHYSTPLLVEGDLPDDDDNYEGQLAEFEAQQAELYNQAMYNQFISAYQLYLQIMAMFSMPVI
jgi:hypothetical protein